METIFYSLHDFFSEVRGLTYLLVACGLVAFFLFLRFLEGRDKDIRKY